MINRASQLALVVKNPSGKAGNAKDVGLIPGSGRSLGGGIGNPLQYSCLENPMDRGGWQAIQSMGSQKVRQDLATKPPQKRRIWREACPGKAL